MWREKAAFGPGVAVQLHVGVADRIDPVRQLVALGSLSAIPRLSTWLTEHVGGASEREQIRIHSLLLGLAPTGKNDHLAALAAFQSSSDPLVRRFLLDESPPDLQRASAMLGDPDPGVRFAAARQLAALGDVLQDVPAEAGAPDFAAAMRAPMMVLVAGPTCVRANGPIT